MTSPRRTIEDLKQMLEPRDVRRAKRQAEFLKYRLNLPTDRTRSDLEGDFLRFLAQHGFPSPEVNVKVGNYTVDFLWREQMLAVETDSSDITVAPRLSRTTSANSTSGASATPFAATPELSCAATQPRLLRSWAKI